MTTQHNRSSGGRRSGRGRRGGRGGRDRDRDENRDDRGQRGEYRPGGRGGSSSSYKTEAAPAAPKKLSFWQKLLSLIGLGPKQPKAKGAPAQRLGGAPKATVTSKYPDRPERSGDRKERGDRPERGERRERGDRYADTPAPAPRPARKPEATEVLTPKLYVGNLSFDATESDLQELFSGAGAVRNTEIVSHKQTQKSKGFGFVTMATVDEAKRAVTELHDKEFMGRKLVVSGAKTPTDRSDASPSEATETVSEQPVPTTAPVAPVAATPEVVAETLQPVTEAAVEAVPEAPVSPEPVAAVEPEVTSQPEAPSAPAAETTEERPN